jgi:hypothetical protein
MKELGEISYYWVIETMWNKEENIIIFGDTKYIKNIIANFGMKNSKLIHISFANNNKIMKNEMLMD